MVDKKKYNIARIESAASASAARRRAPANMNGSSSKALPSRALGSSFLVKKRLHRHNERAPPDITAGDAMPATPCNVDIGTNGQNERMTPSIDANSLGVRRFLKTTFLFGMMVSPSAPGEPAVRAVSVRIMICRSGSHRHCWKGMLKMELNFEPRDASPTKY